MQISKEFIKQCDDERIQGLWKPKVCDLVHVKGIDESIYIIVSIDSYTSDTFILLPNERTIELYDKSELSQHISKLIWLPSLEQLLELCSDISIRERLLVAVHKRLRLSHIFSIFICEVWQTKQAVLQAFAWAKWNMVWKDNKWVKE